ncbi:GNAT family N-acetyltransferase [Ancylobacter sp. Lp-2]|uniref:GNAT family N-acetyltransferase n=1 Tax=Ancylobacter sp. Lp-2 TaxID=2881339 RepID=UPI001E5BA0C2|nr:GNAT family N-acetyltransferase [Ancylobacter sp. Lp-2]MCB4767500.1 GNAT family N-acetyltransferase [Ancylobacter sp. Lp-2]
MKADTPFPAGAPTTPDGVAIDDLRHAPAFTPVVADRIWRAWWLEAGVPEDAVRTRLQESLGPGPIPTTLVALRGTVFLGTASLIASDMEERPALAPWVAALWVEPAYRRAGIGAALTEAASRLAFRLGHARIYLAARPEKAGFYRRRGWETCETDVDGLDILSRADPPG